MHTFLIAANDYLLTTEVNQKLSTLIVPDTRGKWNRQTQRRLEVLSVGPLVCEVEVEDVVRAPHFCGYEVRVGRELFRLVAESDALCVEER